MIYSMTGYGIKSEKISEELITIEVRSLNSKFFDFSFKSHDQFFGLEEEIKRITKRKLKRGKIEIRLKKYNSSSANNEFNLDELKEKAAHLKKISPKSKQEKLLELALLIPRNNQKRIKKLKRKQEKEVLFFVKKVLDEVINFRTREGKTLHKELIKYVNQLSTQLEKIKKRDKKRINNKKKKLKSALKVIAQKYDKTRLEQEMIYYIEKLDISEEIIRLDHHKSYFLELISNENEVGKKINFLVQEMLRETNTIGSKSNDFELQKSVVLIKEKLEKIKEQIQNVL